VRALFDVVRIRLRVQGTDCRVNISSRQLEQEGFVERLRSILAANPLAEPARLEIEVLETGALRDLSHVSQVLRGCQALGITTALDDFSGAGNPAELTGHSVSRSFVTSSAGQRCP
jgi:EAL domain-containing protein (putative c-di-GMP-specific phosphodiesterase class I)